MKGIKLRTFVVFALAAMAGAALLHTSQRVQHAEDRLAQVQSEIAKEKDAIRVLKAEWEYLNRPERLEKLAAEFLELVPPAPDAMPDTMMGEAVSLPSTAQEGEVPKLQPAAFVQEESVPRPRSKPIAARVKKPIPPATKKPKPASKSSPSKNFEALLNEIGGDS